MDEHDKVFVMAIAVLLAVVIFYLAGVGLIAGVGALWS